jgi:hypothetical protein
MGLTSGDLPSGRFTARVLDAGDERVEMAINDQGEHAGVLSIERTSYEACFGPETSGAAFPITFAALDPQAAVEDPLEAARRRSRETAQVVLDYNDGAWSAFGLGRFRYRMRFDVDAGYEHVAEHASETASAQGFDTVVYHHTADGLAQSVIEDPHP